MATVKGWNALMKNIKKQVEDTAKKDVFPVVKDVYQQHIQDEVYDAYSPTSYQRRGHADGLIADDNIVGEYKDGVLEVKDIAVAKDPVSPPRTPYSHDFDTQFASWIERGAAYTGKAVYLFDGDKSGEPWAQPRPFTEKTVDDLATNQQHKKALADGLKKRGIKTE